MPSRQTAPAPCTEIAPGAERYATTAGARDFAGWAWNELRRLPWDGAVAFYTDHLPRLDDRLRSILGLSDRWYLLLFLLRRVDLLRYGAKTKWLYERCREVELSPDDRLDLWAREHWKTSIITVAGVVQEVLRDPELTVGIFSHNRPHAKKPLNVIKREFETNAALKALYPDVLWAEPAREAPRWSDDGGIIVRRTSNPKEATLEAHGLVDGQPTGSHFGLRVYDDVVTDKSVTTPEQVDKTTEAWELSDNLGQVGGRAWYIGTRYHLRDTYAVMLERGVVVPRIHPATNNGRADGNPVLLPPEEWAKKRRLQSRTLAAQMLQNPLAGTDTVFKPEWLRPWEVRPRGLNVYILGDPSRGRSADSDRTAIAVVGLDSAGNKYLLDGYRHRMPLSERWNALKLLRRKWARMPGIHHVEVGYERYGMQSDDEYFQERMLMENEPFPIRELSWVREGLQSKEDRVQRLEPDFRDGYWFLPALVWHPVHGTATWRYDGDEESPTHGQIVYCEHGGETAAMRRMRESGAADCIAQPIKRANEEKLVYDLTVAFIDEYLTFPFGTHDDLIDATSRFHDMEPAPPMVADDRVTLPNAYPDY